MAALKLSLKSKVHEQGDEIFAKNLMYNENVHDIKLEDMKHMCSHKKAAILR